VVKNKVGKFDGRVEVEGDGLRDERIRSIRDGYWKCSLLVITHLGVLENVQAFQKK
jgi:hypothetical protein